MSPRLFLFLLCLCVNFCCFSQKLILDSLFFMNGKIVLAPVIDTTLNMVTIQDAKDTAKREGIDFDELFAVKYMKSGNTFYYYKQDSAIGSFFTRDEMQFFLRGERDAQKGFKPRGSFWGSMVVSYAAGLTGQIVAPVVPFAYLALSGLPKVRIKHDTISNPYYLDSDAYILGYERTARTKRRMACLKGGLSGLLAGFLTNLILDKTGNTLRVKLK